MNRLEKHKEWLEETKTFSNSFLISMNGTKGQSLIIVLENIVSAMDAKEHLRDIQFHPLIHLLLIKHHYIYLVYITN